MSKSRIENLGFGQVIARLPTKTLVRDTSPPFKLLLIKGGFLDSEIPDNAKILRYDASEAEDGSALQYIYDAWLKKKEISECRAETK